MNGTNWCWEKGNCSRSNGGDNGCYTTQNARSTRWMRGSDRGERADDMNRWRSMRRNRASGRDERRATQSRMHRGQGDKGEGGGHFGEQRGDGGWRCVLEKTADLGGRRWTAVRERSLVNVTAIGDEHRERLVRLDKCRHVCGDGRIEQRRCSKEIHYECLRLRCSRAAIHAHCWHGSFSGLERSLYAVWKAFTKGTVKVSLRTINHKISTPASPSGYLS